MADIARTQCSPASESKIEPISDETPQAVPQSHNDNGLGVPPGRYNLQEAADFLGIGRTAMNSLVAQFPYYAKNGNRKLFSQRHINQLWEAMQWPKQNSSSVLEARTGTSAVPTAADPYFNLRKRATEKRQRPSSRSTRLGS